MARAATNITMTPLDDLFKNDEERTGEKVIRVPLTEIYDFTSQYGDNPYKVRDDDDMVELVESIKQLGGIQEPAIVRPRDGGGYELIAGHRRKHGSMLAGLNDMPVIVRNYTDDEAIIIVVDSNLKRENLLPSEKAFAYKMKLDAMKRQAGRPSKDNFVQLGQNYNAVNSRNELAEQTGESSTQIQRYVHLTNLNSALLDMVDNKEIAFNAADCVSQLSQEQQLWLLDIMEKEDCPPSIEQAKRIKKYHTEGKLTYDVIDVIMSEHKEPPIKITLKEDRLRKYFPKSYTAEQIEQKIFKILEVWHKKQLEQQQQR